MCKFDSFNLDKFNAELKTAGLSVDSIYKAFHRAGAQGEVAFSQMASSVLSTNLKLRETHSILSSLGDTLVKTLKWNIASSVINRIYNTISGAFDYVKSLDAALTDIRIVTGQSAD